jgi:hypothetical protein
LKVPTYTGRKCMPLLIRISSPCQQNKSHPKLYLSMPSLHYQDKESYI